MNEELKGTLAPEEVEQFLRIARKMKDNIRTLLCQIGVRLGEEGCPEPPDSAGGQQTCKEVTERSVTAND